MCSRPGRNTTWVFILIFAPLIGALAYFIVELLPEWSNSRGARGARRNLSRALNPDRDLRAASDRLALADTPQNAITLADECMRKGRFAEAKELYQRALKGIHAEDPVLLLGVAKAQFELGDHSGAIQSLDELKAKNPAHTSADGHLLYARAKEQSGALAEAIEEYEALVNYFSRTGAGMSIGDAAQAGRAGRPINAFVQSCADRESNGGTALQHNSQGVDCDRQAGTVLGRMVPA